MRNYSFEHQVNTCLMDDKQVSNKGFMYFFFFLKKENIINESSHDNTPH